MTDKTKPFQFPTADQPHPDNEPLKQAEHDPTEAAIDQGVAESFPASDPVSVNITKVVSADEESGDEKQAGRK